MRSIVWCHTWCIGIIEEYFNDKYSSILDGDLSMNLNKPTVKQHFVPQVYLRGFAKEYLPLHRSNVPNRRHTIYAYDLKERAYDGEDSIPIDSICHKDNLYEIYNQDGDIIYLNWLEKCFKQLEIMYGQQRDILEAKIHPENIGINHFLDRHERAFWITYTAIHVLRNYNVLDAAEQTIREIVDASIPEKEIKSFVRKYCLPFWSELKEDSDEAKILSLVMNPMLNMSMVVGIDTSNSLITSDKGASLIASCFPTNEYDEVVFPITSSLCLIWIGNEKKNAYSNNKLFELSEGDKDYIKQNVVFDAYEKIYSNHRFKQDERKRINKLIDIRNQIDYERRKMHMWDV